MTPTPPDTLETGPTSIPRTLGRWGLATVLLTGGIGHLARPEEFLAQVPPFFPARDKVVYYSTFVEFALALALVLAGRHKVRVGWVVAAFFVAIFPGNISQLVTRTDAFGLDSDLARGVRLLFQPLLVAWALWSTGAWRAWRRSR
ncbi:DoxX family protein [Georgenia wangjunii]|uniref:DoxX family protein n=1 Tax=Georgenia wangjunii TaxID=3117730 RepID=UPI002F262D7A